jgi:hypothetical protein
MFWGRRGPTALSTPQRPPRSRSTRGRFVPANATPIVFVINDEDTVRRALRRVIRSEGFRAEAFALARELLLRGLVTDRAAL